MKPEESDVDMKLREQYLWIEKYVYNPGYKYPGFFILPGVLGLFLLVFLGLPLSIFDLFLGVSGLISILIISIIIAECIMAYFLIFRSKTENVTFRQSLFIGISGLISSLIFLYLAHEMLFWFLGSVASIKIFMSIAVCIYIVIIIIQHTWIFIALKKGFYCAYSSPGIETLRKKMTKIALFMIFPVMAAIGAISPAAYSLTRVLAHTVESTPIKAYIIVSFLMLLPFGFVLSSPVLHWVYMMRKYKNFIPDNSNSN